MATQGDGFYVYHLVDPRTGLPFYVGKGQRDRAWRHEKCVIAGRSSGNLRKDKVIGDLLAFGQRVEVRILAEYDLESDALEHEWRLVDADPTLTNIAPGGIGSANTPAQIERRRQARAKKLADLRAKEAEQLRLRRIDRSAKNFAQNARSERHRQEIDDWASALKAGGNALKLGAAHMSSRKSRLQLEGFRASKTT